MERNQLPFLPQLILSSTTSAFPPFTTAKLTKPHFSDGKVNFTFFE